MSALPATPFIKTIDSPNYGRGKAPALSVLIPYYHDDPAALIKTLDMQDAEGQADKGHKDFEVLLYDDGSADAALSQNVKSALKSTKGQFRALIADGNRGRAFARNYLTREARANWVLFLDADMRPLQPDFIQTYIKAINEDCADIIFGGFVVPPATQSPERELHRFLSQVSDCISLKDRAAAGPQFVASSNLAVRKSVLKAEPFDPEFSGWGWEDSEWAARAARSFRLLHADNPALHLGLETTETLLSRFQSSGANYVRFVRKHPELAKSLALYRISQTLGRIPGQALARPALRGIVRVNALPLRLRLTALKLWRASWYAEAFKTEAAQ